MNNKPLILLFVSVLVFFLGINPLQPSHAATLTLSGLDAGTHEIDFRDIGILSDFTPVISTDKQRYHPGQDGILTVTDHSANVDLNTIETISADIGSNTVILTETGENTGIFQGPFIADGSITYSPENPSDAVRAKISITLAQPGDVTISDVNLSDGIGCPNEPVSQGVNISLSNGAELASVDSVIISYANAVLSFTNSDGQLIQTSPEFLRMHYQFDPNFQYALVAQLNIPGFNEVLDNPYLLTVKTDQDIEQIAEEDDGREPLTLGEGTYVLTSDTGCGGGGGGGISRSGLVIQALGALSLSSGSQVNAPPTMGLGQNEKRIVDDGFSFNDNPINVLQYYTPYPLVTTPVGQNNTIKLKIYEEEGLNNIAHVGLSYGLGKGETFNEGRATIEYDRTFDGVESVTTFDPNHVLGDVNVTTSDVRCGENSNAVCREFTFYHVFREPLEYNMVATNIWDSQLNSWQNYFNHGVQITGKSMNPPKQYSGIFEGHIYQLTETGKNIAVDENGNTWTNDKTWTRDYIKPITVDSNILNDQKIAAIEQLGFGYSDGQAIFGFDRMDHRFADSKEQQKNQAQSIMDDLCPKCQNESYDKINNIFSYSLPVTSKLEQQNQMHIEDQKARQFLQEYFDTIYHNSTD